jgi:2'-5' RNA ligase
VKSGIVVIAELAGPAATRIHQLQHKYDPRMAAELPPHITLLGSSGMGPISARTPAAALRDLLDPIAATTAPVTVHFGAPIRFMQTDIVVLPLDPHGPLRALHERMIERLRAGRVITERPRFTFTPHCTLSFYPELSRARARELLAIRVDDPIAIDRVQLFKTTGVSGTKQLFELELRGPS